MDSMAILFRPQCAKRKLFLVQPYLGDCLETGHYDSNGLVGTAIKVPYQVSQVTRHGTQTSNTLQWLMLTCVIRLQWVNTYKTKWSPFCRQHFQMHFSDKSFLVCLKFHLNWFLMVQMTILKSSLVHLMTWSCLATSHYLMLTQIYVTI